MQGAAFRVVQGGIVVASVSAPSYEQGMREARHYAMMFGQDGPLVIEERRDRKWRPITPPAA